MFQHFVGRLGKLLVLALFSMATCEVLADKTQYELDVRPAPRVKLSEIPAVKLQVIKDIEDVLATEKGDTPISNDRRTEAIRIIGILDLSNFSSELARDVTFEASEFTLKGVRYPAVDALMKIGLPAVPHILSVVSEESTDRELRFLACVMMVCYRDREFALLRLERELEKFRSTGAPIGPKHDNLEKMTDLIRNDPELLRTVFGLGSETWWPAHPSLSQ